MTLLTAWDMASYAHPRIGVWLATLRGVHFLYTSKRKFSYNFIKISQKKGAGHQCVSVLGYQQICQTTVNDFVVVRNNKYIHPIAVGKKPAKVG